MCHQNDCGCERHVHAAPWGRWHHWGYCCKPSHGRRRFLTRDEIINELEEYLKELRSEIKGVEERIAGLKKGD